MSLQVVVTPSETFPDGEAVDNAALRRGATPVVSISGAVDASDIPDGSLTTVKWADNDFNFATKGLDGSITAQKLAARSVTALSAVADDYFYGRVVTTGQVLAMTMPDSPTPITYAEGQHYFFIADVNCPSGGVTININGLGSKSLFKNVASDLAAGDYLAGQIVEIIYDGTNFQVLAPTTVATPQIAGQTKNLVCGNHNYGQATSITRSSGTATMNFSGTPIDFTTGENIWVEGAIPTNYNGTFSATVVNGGQLTYPVSGSPVTPATFPGCLLSTHKIDVKADSILLQDARGNGFIASSVSVQADFNTTVNGTTVLANALDTGSTAASTWYYLWIIYNGLAVASLISLSKTAPTLPTGYTLGKALIGALYSDANKNITPYFQRQQDVTLLPNVVVGPNQAGVATSLTLNLTTVIPPIARKVRGSMGLSTSAVSGVIAVMTDPAGFGKQYFGYTAGSNTAQSLDGFAAVATFEVVVDSVGLFTGEFFVQMSDTGAHYQVTVHGYSL